MSPPLCHCPVCAGTDHALDGHRDGRRICRTCSHRFRTRHTDPVARLRHRAAFGQYLHDLATGRVLTLRAMSQRYQVSETTALAWRRRALRVVAEIADQQLEAAPLAGRVEADEVDLPRGEPGRRSAAAKKIRPSRTRGSRRARGASRRGSVCVVTAVERGTRRSVLRPIASSTTPALLEAFSGVLRTNCRLLTDGDKSYVTVAAVSRARHTRLIVARRARFTGWRHLNTVNGLHAQLRLFLAPFRGLHVRTLPLYLAWFQ